MTKKKVYPNTSEAMRLLRPVPKPGIVRLMERVKHLKKSGHAPLPYNHYLMNVGVEEDNETKS